MLIKVTLNEVGLSRILDHVKDKGTFAVIGSQDKDTKKSRYFELIELIRKLPYRVGWNNLKGTYTYDDGTTGFEDSLIIYNIKKEDAVRIGREINQESIIWKDEDFFGFLDQNGNEDGTLNRGISFNSDDVKLYGSKLLGKHNNAKPFIFEASLIESNNTGSNFSRHNKGTTSYPLFSISYNS